MGGSDMTTTMLVLWCIVGFFLGWCGGNMAQFLLGRKLSPLFNAAMAWAMALVSFLLLAKGAL